MEQNKQLSLQFASISGKKVTADFTGGDVTSDVGVLIMSFITTSSDYSLFFALFVQCPDQRERIHNGAVVNQSTVPILIPHLPSSADAIPTTCKAGKTSNTVRPSIDKDINAVFI